MESTTPPTAPVQTPISPPPFSENRRIVWILPIIAIIVLLLLATIYFLTNQLSLPSKFSTKDHQPMTTVVFAPCDIDRDKDCDRNDYELFLESLHMCHNDRPILQPGFRRQYNELADANHDGCVDIQDEKLLFPVIPSPTPDEMANWKTYTNEQYGFELKYPEEEVFLTSNISTPFLPSVEPLHVENLYTQRSYSGGPDSIVFSIAVYEKSPTISLTEWLSNDIQDLKKAKRRSTGEVLKMAYAGETGIFSYHEYQKGDIGIAELAGVVVIRGEITYAAYITKSGSSYVYVIDLHFGYDADNLRSPKDEHYIKLFDQILSTFRFEDLTTSKFPNQTPTPTSSNQVVCTQEAKLCPDGSYVSRTGLNCEFAPCP